MIGYFPEPYPDELFYSLCARFGDRMKYANKLTVARDLFGKSTATAVVDLPPSVLCTVSTTRATDTHP